MAIKEFHFEKFIIDTRVSNQQINVSNSCAVDVSGKISISDKFKSIYKNEIAGIYYTNITTVYDFNLYRMLNSIISKNLIIYENPDIKLLNRNTGNIMLKIKTMGYAYKNLYNLNHTHISSKGGGAIRIYSNLFRKELINKNIVTDNKSNIAVLEKLNEKISDIDVTLEYNNISEEEAKFQSYLICYEILERYSANIDAIHKNILANNNKSIPYPSVFHDILADCKINTINNIEVKLHYNNKIAKDIYSANGDVYNIGDIINPQKRKSGYGLIMLDPITICNSRNIAFSLCRIFARVDVSLQIVGDNVIYNIPSKIELFDVAISLNTHKMLSVVNPNNINLTFHEQNQVNYNSNSMDVINIDSSYMINAYSIKYIIDDFMIFLFIGGPLFPWTDKKYTKRIRRIIICCFMYDCCVFGSADIYAIYREVIDTILELSNNGNMIIINTFNDKKFMQLIMRIHLEYIKLLTFDSILSYLFQALEFYILHLYISTKTYDNQQSPLLDEKKSVIPDGVFFKNFTKKNYYYYMSTYRDVNKCDRKTLFENKFSFYNSDSSVDLDLINPNKIALEINNYVKNIGAIFEDNILPILNILNRHKHNNQSQIYNIDINRLNQVSTRINHITDIITEDIKNDYKYDFYKFNGMQDIKYMENNNEINNKSDLKCFQYACSIMKNHRKILPEFNYILTDHSAYMYYVNNIDLRIQIEYSYVSFDVYCDEVGTTYEGIIDKLYFECKKTVDNLLNTQKTSFTDNTDADKFGYNNSFNCRVENPYLIITDRNKGIYNICIVNNANCGEIHKKYSTITIQKRVIYKNAVYEKKLLEYRINSRFYKSLLTNNNSINNEKYDIIQGDILGTMQNIRLKIYGIYNMINYYFDELLFLKKTCIMSNNIENTLIKLMNLILIQTMDRCDVLTTYKIVLNLLYFMCYQDTDYIDIKYSNSFSQEKKEIINLHSSIRTKFPKLSILERTDNKYQNPNDESTILNTLNDANLLNMQFCIEQSNLHKIMQCVMIYIIGYYFKVIKNPDPDIVKLLDYTQCKFKISEDVFSCFTSNVLPNMCNFISENDVYSDYITIRKIIINHLIKTIKNIFLNRP